MNIILDLWSPMSSPPRSENMPVNENTLPQNENAPVEENGGMFWTMLTFLNFILNRNAVAANNLETRSEESAQNSTNGVESEEIGFEEFFTPRRNEGFS